MRIYQAQTIPRYLLSSIPHSVELDIQQWFIQVCQVKLNKAQQEKAHVCLLFFVKHKLAQTKPLFRILSSTSYPQACFTLASPMATRLNTRESTLPFCVSREEIKHMQSIPHSENDINNVVSSPFGGYTMVQILSYILIYKDLVH